MLFTVLNLNSLLYQGRDINGVTSDEYISERVYQEIHYLHETSLRENIVRDKPSLKEYGINN